MPHPPGDVSTPGLCLFQHTWPWQSFPFLSPKASLQKAALPGVEFKHAFRIKLKLLPGWLSLPQVHSGEQPYSPSGLTLVSGESTAILLKQPLHTKRSLTNVPFESRATLGVQMLITSLLPVSATVSIEMPPKQTCKCLALRQWVRDAHQCWGRLLKMKAGER